MFLVVDPVDPKNDPKQSGAGQFETEYDVLLLHHETWVKYFASQSASALKAKLEPPGLESPPGMNPRGPSSCAPEVEIEQFSEQA
jgi:hypothetical protein